MTADHDPPRTNEQTSPTFGSRLRLLVEVEIGRNTQDAPSDIADSVRQELEREPGLSAGTRVTSVSVLGLAQHHTPVQGCFDLEQKQLLVNDRPVRLSPRESDVLTHLVNHPKRTITREELKEALGDANGSLGPRAIDVVLSRLRAKLSWTPTPIVTIRGIGYRYEPSEQFVVFGI